MARCNVILILLCWFAVGLLPLVRAQSGDGDGSLIDGDNNGNNNGNGNGNGGNFRFRNGRNGNRFRNGRFGNKGDGSRRQNGGQSGNQGEDSQDSQSSQQADEGPPPVSFTPSGATVETVMTTITEATTIGQPPSTIAIESTFEPPSSIANAFPGPDSSVIATLAGIPYVAPTNTAPSQNLATFFAPEPTLSSFSPDPPFASTSLTITTSKTITVTEPSTEPTPPLPQEAESSAPASPSASASSDASTTPIPSGMTSGSKAGLGIGITALLLALTGATVYFLHRRRRRLYASFPLPSDIKGPATTSSSPSSSHRPAWSVPLPSFIKSRMPRRGSHPGDPEWTIESASKISILRAGNSSARSVSTHTISRAHSPSSFPLPPSTPSFAVGAKKAGRSSLRNEGREERESEKDYEVVRVGMKAEAGAGLSRSTSVNSSGGKFQGAELELARLALGSNPPVFSPVVPPKSEGSGKGGRAQGTASWPLPE